MLHLLECSPIAQFAIDMNHKITVWNKACELLTGYTAQEMIGTSRQWEAFYPYKRPVVADLIIDDDFDTFTELYRNKKGQKSSIVPNALEASSYFPDLGGKARHIYFLAAPIIGEKGQVIGAVETLQDISQQKQLETYLKQESDQLRQENICLKSAMTERYRFGDLVGKSDSMQEVYELIIKAAASDSSVIVYGESGTGKELVARAIHDLSSRKDKEFVMVNCGAIPEALLESEFFGYKRGAFTGAHADNTGYLCAADRGTLFLDEVGDLNVNMQVKLLRAIEGGGYSPLGNCETKNSDFRILAATNRNLEELLDKGLIREDFFYRVHIIPIHLPPLRERKEDLPHLIDHFLKFYGVGKKTSFIPGKVYEALQSYDWPGNVRELQNVLRRYLAINKIDLTRKTNSAAVNEHEAEMVEIDFDVNDLRSVISQFEKNVILKALDNTRWHRGQAAVKMGISRKTLFRKMKEHELI